MQFYHIIIVTGKTFKITKSRSKTESVQQGLILGPQ